MLLDIRQQSATAANGHVQQPVVEAAILGRREFPMGADASLAEFVARLLQCGHRAVGVQPQQTSGYGYHFGFYFGVPQQALGDRRERLE